MKKIIAIVGICSVIFACGSEKTKSTEETGSTSTSVASTEEVANTAAGSAKGEELITKSDCLSCHKTDAKIVGPSYIDVANKYPANDENIAMLANKIIQGGSGNWGEIPMAPHPSISTENATEMVKYILSLKTN
jgi:cytochrome c